MAKSQQTFNKSEKEKKRLKNQRDKLKRKEVRKSQGSAGFDDMIVYVDVNGNFTDTPPDLSEREEIVVESIAIAVPKSEDVVIVKEKQGIVEFFNDSKGFGFIKEIGTNEKYFVHVNGLIDEIIEGNKVSFELEKGMKGMNAVLVKKI
ncbi:MAG: cold shock domain-containing protein [Bacteroidales bacterium]|jgi:cold shock CspA family protein|nr:cold shock domain-containing protein [Bacteroidales bacterium]